MNTSAVSIHYDARLYARSFHTARSDISVTMNGSLETQYNCCNKVKLLAVLLLMYITGEANCSGNVRVYIYTKMSRHDCVLYIVICIYMHVVHDDFYFAAEKLNTIL